MLDTTAPNDEGAGRFSSAAAAGASLLSTPAAFLIIAAVLFGANLAVWFPGMLNGDSAGQYAQALSGQLTDWQPPIMSVLWRTIHPLVAAPWPLFVLNTALYWAGFALIGHAYLLKGRPWPAYLVLLSGASPVLIFFNRQVITDVGLASALLAAFAIIFSLRSRGRNVGILSLVLLALLFAYAVLVRANAAFAVAPMLLYAVGWTPRLNRPGWWAAAVALSIVLLPVTFVVNRGLLGAQDSGGVQRLQLFDLVGIAEQTGDRAAVAKALGRDPGPLARCYTPLFWDTLLTERCGYAWQALPPVGSRARAEIPKLWLSSIAHHPLAYASHRLKQFNAGTMFLVPAAEQCVAAPEMHDCGRSTRAIVDPSVVRSDFVMKSFFVWPITWLVLGVGLLFLFARPPPTVGLGAANALLASALLYGLAFLFVGLAVNVRYYYWTIMAVQTALIMGFAELRGNVSRRALAAILVPLVVVAGLGYLFRIAAIGEFLTS